MSEFEAVIGLEIHCQLATKTKLFCRCKAKLHQDSSVADELVNGNTCPICGGHPGTLPVLNRQAVEFAVTAGLSLGCEIRDKSVFARKNYFYPDLPKGYQISQYELPICEKGHIEIEMKDGSTKKVGITRIHMEEDAGKNVHMSGFSLVNLNRAGMPLIEIVSEPDIRSPEEAGAYMRAVHAIVTYTGICDGNMQEGNFRCDANVSVRPKGQKEFGTRAEIKNVNSFRFVEKAIEYEISRQIEVVQSGGQVVQETRTYDADQNVTVSMRSKEEAHDYRYFPEPDLVPLILDDGLVTRLGKDLPELPARKKARFVEEYGLSAYDAGVLTASKVLAEFFEASLKTLSDPAKGAKTAANLTTGEISRLIKEQGKEVSDSQLTPKHLTHLVELLMEGSVSSTAAKQVLGEAWEKGTSVDKIVADKGLKQVSDAGSLEPVIDEIIAKNPTQVEQFRGGKEKLLGFFVGQAMKATQGKANPGMLQEILKKKLKG